MIIALAWVQVYCAHVHVGIKFYARIKAVDVRAATLVYRTAGKRKSIFTAILHL